MASQHPLDIFRSSNSGFESASRRRRTIAGRVITSRAREAEADDGLDSEVDVEVGADVPAAPAQAGEVELTEAAAPQAKAEAGQPRAEPEVEAGRADDQGHGKGRRRKRQKGRKARAGQQAVLPGVVAEALAPEVPLDADDEGADEPETVAPVEAEPARAAATSDAAPEAREPGRPTRITGAAARPGRLTPAPLGARVSAPVEPTRTRETGAAKPAALAPRRAGSKLPGLALAGAAAVLLALVTWIVVATLGDEAPELTTLNAAQALDGGEPAAQVPVFGIQVASYSASDKGQRMAWEAHDELVARGYADVDVIGQQSLNAEGQLELSGCVLMVGRAGAEADLDDLRNRLAAVGDWPFGERRPFLDARIVEHPHP